ncbi:Uncharacterised protein [Salmonella enterica subsp. enterica]|nr:Uncharacterised protein [Salmonella enterica subsp. enterica] [Salmonella enterica subsp. enterica serovar Singapore]
MRGILPKMANMKLPLIVLQGLYHSVLPQLNLLLQVIPLLLRYRLMLL